PAVDSGGLANRRVAVASRSGPQRNAIPQPALDAVAVEAFRQSAPQPRAAGVAAAARIGLDAARARVVVDAGGARHSLPARVVRQRARFVAQAARRAAGKTSRLRLARDDVACGQDRFLTR